FAGFGTNRLRCEEAMKTAGRENPNRCAKTASNRAHGAEVQHRSCSIHWAAKQEKVQGCFFLTSPFIELIRSWELAGCGEFFSLFRIYSLYALSHLSLPGGRTCGLLHG